MLTIPRANNDVLNRSVRMCTPWSVATSSQKSSLLVSHHIDCCYLQRCKQLVSQDLNTSLAETSHTPSTLMKQRTSLARIRTRRLSLMRTAEKRREVETERLRRAQLVQEQELRIKLEMGNAAARIQSAFRGWLCRGRYEKVCIHREANKR